jgi:hypothetical protein
MKDKTKDNTDHCPAECTALTPEQAAEIVKGWIIPFLCDDETIGDFLLILRALCYRRDLTDRETLVNQIENVITPYAPAIAEATSELLQRRLALAAATEASN